MVFLDFETTGFEATRGITEVVILVVSAEMISFFHAYVLPSKESHSGAIKAHGLDMPTLLQLNAQPWNIIGVEVNEYLAANVQKVGDKRLN